MRERPRGGKFDLLDAVVNDDAGVLFKVVHHLFEQLLLFVDILALGKVAPDILGIADGEGHHGRALGRSVRVDHVVNDNDAVRVVLVRRRIPDIFRVIQ